MITSAQIRDLLDIDYASGRMYWKHRPAERAQWNGRYAGKEAFTGTSYGYKQGAIFGKLYLAHRVIYAAAYDTWPELIDHINRDRADNRLSNLRAADKSLNSHNAKTRDDNTSGFCGVAWSKRQGSWRAYINEGGRQRHLGFFDHLADAVAARAKAFETLEPKG